MLQDFMHFEKKFKVPEDKGPCQNSGDIFIINGVESFFVPRQTLLDITTMTLFNILSQENLSGISNRPH